MIRKFLLALGLLLALSTLVFSQTGSLQGVVKDKETKEPIPFCTVVLKQNGMMVSGAATDFDGKYVIKPITPGTYNVEVSFVGYNTQIQNGVIVGARMEFLNVDLASSATDLQIVEVVDYKVPLISKDNTQVGSTVTAEEIAKMPNRSASAVQALTGGVVSTGGVESIRGAREGSSITYIDGVKVIGSTSLPASAYEQINVIIGGLSARYGDVTGGVTEITTKGATRDWFGGLELSTTKYLDPFGQNSFMFSISGPLISKKDANGFKNPIAGFFLSGEVYYNEAAVVSGNGYYRGSDEYLQYLIENPLTPSTAGDGLDYTSLYTKQSDLMFTKNVQNSESFGGTFSGKLTFALTKNIDFTVGGRYTFSNGKGQSFPAYVFNYQNAGKDIDQSWMVYGRFVHRFPTSSDSKSVVKNAYYTLQGSYTQVSGNSKSDFFGDDVFKYGYWGSLEVDTRRSYEQGRVEVDGRIYDNVMIQNGFQDMGVTWTPGGEGEFGPNVGMMNYNNFAFDYSNGGISNYTDLLFNKGLRNGDLPNGSVYGLFDFPGVPYAGYSKYSGYQATFNALASANIGNHELQIGFEFNQQAQSTYSVNTTGLWTLMNDLTNFHIQELDTENPMLNAFKDTVNYNRKYDGASQRFFDKQLREKMGLNTTGTDFINIHSYDYSAGTIQYYDQNGKEVVSSIGKDLFSINMFSPDELLGSNGESWVGAVGYDYYGNKLKGKPTLDDFLTNTYSGGVLDGQYKRWRAPNEPIYMAGFIQDKFAIDDIIFQLGLRVDRYDANRYQLKDPYSFYPTMTVSELLGNSGNLSASSVSALEKANSRGWGDYVVYVNSLNNPTEVNGYRYNNTWYNSEFIIVDDPSKIASDGSTPTPYLNAKAAGFQNQSELTAQGLKPTTESFTKYKASVNVMPRVSFSFPISDDALFFAHYDILTQRPGSSYNGFNMSSYYFYATNTTMTTLQNPALIPEQTIDYELGFTQKVSATSALTISAFYKEMRNMINLTTMTGAFPRQYYTYSNIDFGTSKGLTLSYDLRRTGNVSLKASYTIMFAETSGTSASSAAALIAAGLPNLRMINPSNVDQRHGIKVIFDYRFSEGKAYNGPVAKRKNGKEPVQILKNFGLNLTLNAGSGLPYTRSQTIKSPYLLLGTMYGSRMPWSFYFDGRIDKDFDIKVKQKEGKQKTTYMNVYLTVENIFNIKNVRAVYPYTGNPDDDGYLTSPQYQKEISQNLDEESFRLLYGINMNNPNNFSAPRTIRLGLMYSF